MTEARRGRSASDNTVTQRARTMKYVDKYGKAVAPWKTDYLHGQMPEYKMHPELAKVIMDL